MGQGQAASASPVATARLLAYLDRRDIPVWLDGGWGVDALLSEVTRLHSDLDLVVETRHLAALEAALAARGFGPCPRDDTRPWNFALADASGLEVDLHVIRFDAQGRALYGPNGAFYPAHAFEAPGRIGATRVRCLTPRFQAENRTGYPLRARDSHDLRVLNAAFGPFTGIARR
ncbi:MAG: aminoglycoside nucleotidyltransferase [Pseudomonadota bacterium]